MKISQILVSALVLGSGTKGHAADPPPVYPDKPIHVIVPFAPGAASDAFGRLVGQKFTDAWGQPAIIENRIGGGAVVGTEVVARARSDGYTVLLTMPAFGINATGIRPLPYDTIRDFAPVSQFASTAMIIVVNSALPVTTVRELIAHAKSQPGKLTFASGGNGSINQLGIELLKLQGVQMTHVPYKGGGPALADVVSGRVDLMLSSVLAVQSLLKAGRLRPVAVTTAGRSALFPDVPSVAETVPGFEAINWAGIVAPAGTPRPIVDKINGVLVRYAARARRKRAIGA